MKREKNELSTFQKVEGPYDCQQMTIVQLKQECPICGRVTLLEGEISNNTEILYCCEQCEKTHTLCDCGEVAPIKRRLCDVCWEQYLSTEQDYFMQEDIHNHKTIK